MDPSVSIIIVNYKTSSLIKDCLSSVTQKTKDVSFEVIIVDNSNDMNEFSSLAEIQHHFQNITLFNVGQNIGFGNANNFGAKAAKGRYLLFLNSDTIMINNAVGNLYKAISESEDIGAIGPNIFTKTGKPGHSFLRHETTSGELIIRRSFFSTIKRRLTKNDQFNFTNHPLDISGYVCGACMMIPKDVFWAVGGFDSEIFMYSEDNLLCYLIKKKGLKIVNLPTAKIIHLEGQSDSSIFSESKIKNMVYGDFIRQIRAYGYHRARRYLWIASFVYHFVFIRKKLVHLESWKNDKRLSAEYLRLLRSLDARQSRKQD